MNRLILFFLASTICSYAQNRNNDSLWGIFKNESLADTTRMKAIGGIARKYPRSNPDSAFIIGNIGLEFARKTNQKKAEAGMLNTIGLSFFYRGNHPKALEYYLQSLKIREGLGDKKAIAASLNNIGGIYVSLNDKLKGLQYFNKAEQTAEELGDKYVMSNALGNISNIYAELPDSICLRLGLHIYDKYVKALEYSFKSLKLADEIGNKESVAITYSDIGRIYAEIPDEACDHVKIKVSEKYNKALEYLQRSIALKEQNGDKQGTGLTFGVIASLYQKQKKYPEALKYAIKSLDIAVNVSDVETEISTRKTLYEIYKAMNQPGKGLEQFEKYVMLRDSINSEDYQKEILNKELNYEFEKKEALLKAREEKERDVAAAESKKQQFLIGLITTIAVSIGAVAFFILLSWRTTNKQKKIIEAKNKEIVDSIHYAQRIQRSLLTTEKYIDKTLKRLFNSEQKH